MFGFCARDQGRRASRPQAAACRYRAERSAAAEQRVRRCPGHRQPVVERERGLVQRLVGQLRAQQSRGLLRGDAVGGRGARRPRGRSAWLSSSYSLLLTGSMTLAATTAPNMSAARSANETGVRALT